MYKTFRHRDNTGLIILWTVKRELEKKINPLLGDGVWDEIWNSISGKIGRVKGEIKLK